MKSALQGLAFRFDEHGCYDLTLPDVLDAVSGGYNEMCQNTACVRVNSVCGDGGLPSVNVPDVIDANCNFPDMMCAMCSC